MKSTIAKIYIVNILTGIVFWYPIEKLFMRSLDITPFQIGVNAVVLLAITILLDVPAGVLADRWRRTHTILIALAALAASALLLGASNGFTGYMIGTAMYGIYIVCSSGTFQALMYDTLLDSGRQKEYDKYQGRSYALFLAGVSISSLVGGYLAYWYGYRATYYLSIIPAVLAGIILLSIREPRMHKKIHDKQYLNHLGKGFKALHVSPLVFHLTFFAVVAGVLRNTQNEFSGLYYIALGLTAIPTGYVNAFKWLSSSLGYFNAQHFGRRSLLFAPVLFISFALFSMIDSRFGIPFFLVSVFLYAVMQNQAEAEIQNHVDSTIRATAISTISFTSNIILVPFSLAFGWIAGQYSVFRSYQMIALIGLAYMVFWLFKSRPHILDLLRENKNALMLQPAEDIEVIK